MSTARFVIPRVRSDELNARVSPFYDGLQSLFLGVEEHERTSTLRAARSSERCCVLSLLVHSHRSASETHGLAVVDLFGSREQAGTSAGASSAYSLIPGGEPSCHMRPASRTTTPVYGTQPGIRAGHGSCSGVTRRISGERLCHWLTARRPGAMIVAGMGRSWSCSEGHSFPNHSRPGLLVEPATVCRGCR